MATRLPGSSRGALRFGGPYDLVRVGQRMRACASFSKGAIIVTNIMGIRVDLAVLAGSTALLVQWARPSTSPRNIW